MTGLKVKNKLSKDYHEMFMHGILPDANEETLKSLASSFSIINLGLSIIFTLGGLNSPCANLLDQIVKDSFLPKIKTNETWRNYIRERYPVLEYMPPITEVCTVYTHIHTSQKSL